MRVSIWIGFIILALGIALSYLADAMIETQATGPVQTTAVLVASILFVLFSAGMLGFGAGLVVHWIVGFAKRWKAATAEIVLSFATFFMGIGATIMSDNWWTAAQVFFTFLTASMTLFMLSFVSIFGGIAEGFVKIRKYIKKRFKR